MRRLRNRGKGDDDDIHQQRRISRSVEVVMTNNSTHKPSLEPPTLQQPSGDLNQATTEKKLHDVRRYIGRAVQKRSNSDVVKSAHFSIQENRKPNTQQHIRQLRGRQKKNTTQETRRIKTRKAPGSTSSKLNKVSPMAPEKESKLASNTSQQHDVKTIVREKRYDLNTSRDAPDENRDLPIASDANCELPIALQMELNALIQESSKPEKPVKPKAESTLAGKIGNVVNYKFIHALIEETFYLCGDCGEVLFQEELDEASELSVQVVDREITEAMNINRMPTFDVTENFTEKTKKVIEFTKALEEDAEMQTEEAKAREVDRLKKLLPRALWMSLNNERRQEVFTSDHIRSLLRLHFDEESFARKSAGTRAELLAELQKINDQNPDLMQVAARLYL